MKNRQARTRRVRTRRVRTRRIFREDADLSEFTAIVLEARESGEDCGVILDASAFYAESGGQPPDRGILGDADVVDVQEDDGVIVHTIRGKAPTAGDEVVGRVDMETRRDHSCQHTAQHAISAVAREKWGAKTVGFHLGRETSTVDLENFDADAVKELEDGVNRIVREDRPVTVEITQEKENVKFRTGRVLGPDEEVRFVEIHGLVRSACGGTHLKSTAQAGLVKLLKTDKVRNSTRVEFVAGLRSLKKFQQLQDACGLMSTLTSAGVEDVPAWIKAAQKQLKELKKENEKLAHAALLNKIPVLVEKAEEVAGLKLVCTKLEDLDMRFLREGAKEIRKNAGTVALLGSVHNGRGSLVFAASDDVDVDMAHVLKKVLESIGAKGGGNSTMAQSGGLDPLAVEEALSRARDIVTTGTGD